MGGHVNPSEEAPAKFQGRVNKPGDLKIKGTEIEIKISETIARRSSEFDPLSVYDIYP